MDGLETTANRTEVMQDGILLWLLVNMIIDFQGSQRRLKANQHSSDCQDVSPLGSRYRLPGPWRPEWDPGPEYDAYVCVFLGITIICRLYKSALSDQTTE
jgi:hypothetical protein